MSLWRQLTHGLRVLVRRGDADRDTGDEAQHYIDQAIAEKIADGLTPEAARRIVQQEVGSVSGLREEVRTHGWEHLAGTFAADVRYALRRLRHTPGFSLLAIATLAIGIGASTAIFSAVNPILFAPLPYPQSGRVVALADFGRDRGPAAITFGTFREVVARSRSFDAAAVIRSWQSTLATEDESERFTALRVSADYFRVLRVSPALGRGFDETDDVLNGPRVVVISQGLWQRRFGADPGVIGRTVRLDDNNFTIVGVMPSDYEDVVDPAAQLWEPLQYDKALPIDGREWGHHLKMIARLHAGVTIDQARQELAAIGAHQLAEFPRVPWAQFPQGLLVNSLQEDVTRAVRPALLAVLGAVVLVLLIACVNVTNLLIARTTQRRGEFAVRAALGAARGRMVRQLLTESLILALIGGALGVAVATGSIRALVALMPPEFSRSGAIHVDGAVLAFGFVVTTAIGLLVGTLPALHASGDSLHGGLQRHSRRTAGAQGLTRGVLVVAEVALALVLLISAGLLLRSLDRLFAVSVGFDTSRLLTMQVVESGTRFTSDSARYRFYVEALDEVRRVPGVVNATFTSQLPLSGDQSGYGVHFQVDPDNANDYNGLLYAVEPAYFETMRIPLRKGRLLDQGDTFDAPRAALINESFAKEKFPGQEAIGQRIHVGPDDGRWYTIVGVVGDVTQASLAAGSGDAVYVTPPQWHWVERVMSFVVRARGDAAALATATRAAIGSVDKHQPIVRVATMDGLLARSESRRRFALILFEAFALAALVLAATGIYGVLAGSVTERTREIGVRAALGASSGTILGLVLRQGMTLTAIGTLIGVAGAIAASQALVTLLFGVSRLDPVTYGGVIVLLLCVSAAACSIPAWRAARVDPVLALRGE